MIEYKDGFRYQLHSTYSIRLPWLAGQPDYHAEFLAVQGDLLTIDAGYAWDGPSGPTWDSKNSMRASLVHDALYQLMRIGVLPEDCRAAADDVLYNLCVEDGMFKWRAWAWWKGVRWGAGAAAKKGTEREIIIAP
jgi:hypothetical protein